MLTLLFRIQRRICLLLQNETMLRFLLISLGAILGANARYWLGGWVNEKLGVSFPYGTLVVNLTGSFLLGLFLTLSTERFLIDPAWRWLIAIGFLGSYTTFSTYTYESLILILSGQIRLGILNLLSSTILGALAALGGILLGRVL